MIAILFLFLVPALLAFPLALLLPRAGKAIAPIVGIIPAAWMAVENGGTLPNPMTLFILFMFLAPSLAGTLFGP